MQGKIPKSASMFGYVVNRQMAPSHNEFRRHEMVFSKIHPEEYQRCKSSVTKEHEWEKKEIEIINLHEKGLTKIQKKFFKAIREKDLDTFKDILRTETSRPEFQLRDLLDDHHVTWSIVNPLSPDQ